MLCSLVNYIKSIKYIINKFYLERVIYDIKYDGIVSVNSKDGMFKNKYNYINGVGEKFVIFNNVWYNTINFWRGYYLCMIENMI